MRAMSTVMATSTTTHVSGTGSGVLPALCIPNLSSVIISHSYDSGKITTQPTFTSEGKQTYTCTRCGTTKTESIPKLTNPFLDVSDTSWYVTGSVYAFNHGYMSGTSDAAFSPNTGLTRGMVVLVLANIEGVNLSGYASKNTFTDVAKGQWYHNAVEWAVENGIASGISKTKFNPNGTITRQDLAVMLYKYAQKYKCAGGKSASNITGYADYSKVSSYAREALGWAVGNGLISGTSATTISPKATATRAQFAVIIKNYDANVGHYWNAGEVNTTRTCTVNGKTTYICTICGKTLFAETKAWHKYKSVITTQPTCTTTGWRRDTCTVCGTYNEIKLAATGHTYDSGKITTVATCGKSGWKRYTCTKCGDYKDEAIPATGKHNWKSAITTQPTCTTTGWRRDTCTVCGTYNDVKLAALGHSYNSNGICTRCGYDSTVRRIVHNGYTIVVPGEEVVCNSWRGKIAVKITGFTVSGSSIKISYTARCISLNHNGSCSFSYKIYDPYGAVVCSDHTYSMDLSAGETSGAQSFYISGTYYSGLTYTLKLFDNN